MKIPVRSEFSLEVDGQHLPKCLADCTGSHPRASASTENVGASGGKGGYALAAAPSAALAGAGWRMNRPVFRKRVQVSAR